MRYAVTLESFASLAPYWNRPDQHLKWESVFVLPVWMEVWWREFQPRTELHLVAVREEADIIGVAPLQLADKQASFVGSTDVCDYMDFVVTPGRESDFFAALLDDLRQKGIGHLELKHVRPDSVVATRFADWARNQGCDVACQAEAVSLEMDLPPTWEEYLAALSTKQRHEVGRKLRRLAEMGNTGYRSILDRTAALTAMEIFVKLFSESRRDKAAFMTSRMESFFKAIAAAMVDAGLLRLGVLELDTVPTAMIMCFDLNGTVYLYNSGYDPQYAYLSPGLLSKVSCIKDSIEKGRKRFDFLKGSETYKYHLGGKEVPLYAYQIAIR